MHTQAATARRPEPQISPAARYAERSGNIATRIEQLQAVLTSHKLVAGATPNWGECGDLGYIESTLGQIVDAFTSQRTA